jgi:MFS family permease
MLPLAGEALVFSKEAFSSLIVSALIIVPQLIVALMASWAGRRANTWGRRPLLLVGFAALPIRALVFAWTTSPMVLIAAQILDGVSGTMLGVLTALIVSDLTRGTGRFSLALGFVGTMSGIGASLSTTLTGLVAGSFGRAAGFLSIAAVALVALNRQLNLFELPAQAVDATQALNRSAGVSKPKVLRGRSLSWRATWLRRSCVYTDKSVPFGKYCRSRPLVLSSSRVTPDYARLRDTLFSTSRRSAQATSSI